MITYKIEDNFMIREPMFNLKKYNSIFSKNENVDQNLINILNDKRFKEILFVNNKNLYYQMMKITELDPNSKRYKHLLKSLGNYVNRICTRATPYGLDATVSLGKFSKKEVKNNSNNLTKHIYPDMEWLSKVIRRVETDIEDIPYLCVKWNNIVVRDDIYFKLLFVKDDEKKNLQRRLKITPIIEKLSSATQDVVLVKELIDNLQNYMHVNNSNSILKIIQALIVNNFLITNISLNNVNKDNFGDFIKILKNIPKEKAAYELLVDIKKKMELYHETKLGSGTEILKKLATEMEAVQPSTNYIHVDFQKDDQLFSVKEKPKNLARLISFLRRVTPDYKKSDYLENYAKAFLDKYGPYTEVPLLVLLDPDKGLGSPYSTIFSTSTSDAMNNEQSILLKEAIIESIANEKKCYDIEKCNLPDMSNQNYINNFPTSLEVYVKKISDKDKNLHNLMLVPSSGSDKSGKTFGRFTYMFNRNNPLKQLTDEIEVADIPKNKRVLNVMLTDTNNSIVNIDTICQSSKNINLKDILVGIEKNNDNYYFYFKSRVTKSRLFFSVTSMVNYKNSKYLSYIASFLIEASHSKESNPFYIVRLLENFDTFPRIPAFYYKNIILTPLRWNFNKYTLGRFSSKLELKEKLDCFIEKWKVPRLVCLERNDNRILLNLSLNIHKNELINEILSRNNVSVYEPFLNNINELPEYVYSFNDVSFKNKNSLPAITRELAISSNSKRRKVILGDDWVYFKIYCSRDNLKSLITCALSNLYQKLYNKKYIKLFHYVLFKDPYYHIRIRFKLLAKQDFSKVIECINVWGHELLEKDLITNITFDTYDREIERYGGLRFIEYVEQIFNADSIDTMNHFAETMYSSIDKTESIEEFALKLGFSLDIQKEILIKRFNYSPKWKGIYSKNKKYVHDYKSHFIDFIKQKKRDFNKLPLYSNKNRKLSTYDIELFFSLIHMHCNRIGIKHGNDEMEIMLLWLKLVKEADYYLGVGKNK